MEKTTKPKKNYAFIDGQNLHYGTHKLLVDPWRVDLLRFRKYLEHKYKVVNAYYFLGCVQEENQEIYEEIQKAGFVLVFRQHSTVMIGKKKGNVDSDLIFHIMKKIYKQEDFDKVVLVSGDGDYKLVVDFLIEENRLEKILFPNKKFASSLYKKIGASYYDYLDSKGLKDKIGKKKEEDSLGI